MHIKEQDKDKAIFIKHNNLQSKEKTHMWAPTKAQFILYEFISQIPLFWNYEKIILAYVKSRETKDYLKTRVKLKLFERKLDF